MTKKEQAKLEVILASIEHLQYITKDFNAKDRLGEAKAILLKILK